MKLTKIAKVLLILGDFLVWEGFISSWILKTPGGGGESGQDIYPFPWGYFGSKIILEFCKISCSPGKKSVS